MAREPRQLNRWLDASTWLNTLVSAAGTLITIALAAGLSFSALGAQSVLIGGIAALAIIIAQGVAIFILIQGRVSLSPPMLRGVADAELYKHLHGKTSELALKQARDLSNGTVRLHGPNVLEHQLDLMRWLIERADPVERMLLAIDLTGDPKILDTRLRYWRLSLQLMKSGGVIRRIFMIKRERFAVPEWRDSLSALMKKHRSAGVAVGISFEDEVKSEEVEDFIAFGRFAVLVEGRQADAGYAAGFSELHLSEADISVYRERFQRVWAPSNGENAGDRASRFLDNPDTFDDMQLY